MSTTTETSTTLLYLQQQQQQQPTSPTPSTHKMAAATSEPPKQRVSPRTIASADQSSSPYSSPQRHQQQEHPVSVSTPSSPGGPGDGMTSDESNAGNDMMDDVELVEHAAFLAGARRSPNLHNIASVSTKGLQYRVGPHDEEEEDDMICNSRSRDDPILVQTSSSSSDMKKRGDDRYTPVAAAGIEQPAFDFSRDALSSELTPTVSDRPAAMTHLRMNSSASTESKDPNDMLEQLESRRFLIEAAARRMDTAGNAARMDAEGVDYARSTLSSPGKQSLRERLRCRLQLLQKKNDLFMDEMKGTTTQYPAGRPYRSEPVTPVDHVMLIDAEEDDEEEEDSDNDEEEDSDDDEEEENETKAGTCSTVVDSQVSTEAAGPTRYSALEADDSTIANKPTLALEHTNVSDLADGGDAAMTALSEENQQQSNQEPLSSPVPKVMTANVAQDLIDTPTDSPVTDRKERPVRIPPRLSEEDKPQQHPNPGTVTPDEAPAGPNQEPKKEEQLREEVIPAPASQDSAAAMLSAALSDPPPPPPPRKSPASPKSGTKTGSPPTSPYQRIVMSKSSSPISPKQQQHLRILSPPRSPTLSPKRSSPRAAKNAVSPARSDTMVSPVRRSSSNRFMGGTNSSNVHLQGHNHHQQGPASPALVRLSRTVRYGRRGPHPKRTGNTIKLHIYDLIQSETVMALPLGLEFPIGKCFQTCNTTLHALGTGAYHCGVEVNGVEYAYGANDIPGSTGVFTCIPKQSPGYEYRLTLDFGDRPLVKQEWVMVEPENDGGSSGNRSSRRGSDTSSAAPSPARDRSLLDKAPTTRPSSTTSNKVVRSNSGSRRRPASPAASVSSSTSSKSGRRRKPTRRPQYRAQDVYLDGRDVMRGMALQYKGMEYDLLRQNCCTFAKDACVRLGIDEKEIPSWFMNLAGAGAAAQDVVNWTPQPIDCPQPAIDLSGMASLNYHHDESKRRLAAYGTRRLSHIAFGRGPRLILSSTIGPLHSLASIAKQSSLERQSLVSKAADCLDEMESTTEGFETVLLPTNTQVVQVVETKVLEIDYSLRRTASWTY